MVLVSAASGATSVSQKEKTKAKQRYLKRKKEKKKHRKLAAPQKSGHEAPGGQNSEAEGDEDTWSHEDLSETENNGGGMERTDSPVVVKEVVKEEKRPRKRRKIAEDHPIVVESIPQDDPVDEDVLTEQPLQTKNRKSPTPVASLPSFPLPALPDAPSQSVLALQGLDRALVDAEIVDPATLLSIPEGEDDAGTGLSEKIRKRLKDLGITELFAVQTTLLPFLLPSDRLRRSLYLPYDPPRDVCVSAPTGSGKTLAYVLPIIEILSPRIVTRLRALVVLPTRDLVIQVRETFEAIGKGRGLKIGTATGQHSFAHEQAQLITDSSPNLQGGSSKVDVLICTPGRLMDHLNGTPNFSLQHLRFLVIDEADRLLAQSFQDWLAQVLVAARPPPRLHPDSSAVSNLTHSTQHSLPYPDALSPPFLHILSDTSDIRTDIDERKEPSCQKLLFSATLTRDPGKIAALDLRDPKYYVIQGKNNNGAEGVLDMVMEKFSMPTTLTERMIICESSQKPLMLFYLVHTHNVTNALVFTKSAESTTRLVRLFEFFEKSRAAHPVVGEARQSIIRAYSSDLGASERKIMLEKFRAQEIQILVCSDLISRGIDISHVSHVVSYDVPVDMRKYVHRVGRTARAGRTGSAWTLVEEQEARYFKLMLKSADHLEKVKKMRITANDLAPLVPHYEVALGHLKEAYIR